MSAHLEELVGALGRLDARLASALRAFDAAQGGVPHDRFRGLYISPEQSRSLLALDPGSPMFTCDASVSEPLWPALRGTLAECLASAYGLSPFDLDVLLIAFAPEFDLRYERIYAYLQDDVTRKRPTVDLMLNLLCANERERLTRRRAFDADAALLRHDVITLVHDPAQHQPPLLAQSIKPDEQVVRVLLGSSGLDSRLAGCCRLEQPETAFENLALPVDTAKVLTSVARGAFQGATSVLWFSGPAGAGKRSAAAATARAAGRALLILDTRLVATTDLEITLRRAMREAAFHSAVLYLQRVESWLGDPQITAALAGLLRRAACPTMVGSTEPAPPDLAGIALPVPFPMPDVASRALCWRNALAARGIDLDAGTLAALAHRFRLTPGQISSSVSDAVQRGAWHRHAAAGKRARTPAAADLFAAARAQSSQALAAVADKIEPRATWEDLVLPADALAQLQEICQRVEHRERVLHEWGFARKSARGLGVNALFAGSSGTGKTMAAEVVANALGLDLYRIDLARVVSKYIGETEKNLDRVFTAASGANAILFFDEADALFGKRSEVKDSHDRYANIEISYLLQKMEEYDGVAILATNLAENLDDAFTRRLAFHVHFPFPDEASRLQIWKQAWPRELPIADTVDYRMLARDLKMSGGGIRNAALAAAYAAAPGDGVVEFVHVIHAVRREYQKAGRSSVLGTDAGDLRQPFRPAVRG